jgi:polar amino acid transport system permease protein
MDVDLSPLVVNWRFLAGGLWLTVLLSLSSALGAMVVGLVIGLARCYAPRPVRIVLAFYVDSMRAIPVLVVLVWIFFAVPILTGVTLPPFWAALTALTLHIAAYVSEIVRAGIDSIRPGQIRAALALGMSRAQLVRRIILPQATVRMLPTYGSLLSVTIKDTAIASVIAVPELMRQSETIAAQSFRPLEVFTSAMLVYFVILFPMTRGIDRLYRRVAHLGRS